MDAFLGKPFNDPTLEEGYCESDFLKESSEAFSKLRRCLETVGKFDKNETNGDPADFWMQNSGGITRTLSVTLTSRKLWNDALIPLIQSFLNGLPKDYLVYIDSDFDLEEMIFILVMKDQALGNAENRKSLKPFGF